MPLYKDDQLLCLPDLFVSVAVLLDKPVSECVECRVRVGIPRLYHALQTDSWGANEKTTSG